MASIQILPSALSDQIAAGEVVERPSSVAKELLENALDAGATRITVDFTEGGVKKFRIVDNGCGMTPDDAVLSIRRHATSKIYTLNDLASIGTLGFRGEALASIASVSKFKIRTKQKGCLSATQVNVVGGAEPIVSEAGGPVGTEIIVEDLFFNVPARLKFLKKPQTESTHIVETVQRLALCYPKIAFKVIRDGRTVLDLPIHETLLERLEEMFPRSTTSGLKTVSVLGSFGVAGVIGKPQDARGSTRHYYLFVNGRIVKDRVMMSAVQSGCGQLLVKGKHPFAVISLTLPSQAVDVNVHPAKTEVRFADSRQIYRLIARSVEAALTRVERTDQPLLQTSHASPISSLQIKRIVDASDDGVERVVEGQTSNKGTGLTTQKRRVFDAMARLARKQHAQSSSKDRGHTTNSAPAMPQHQELNPNDRRGSSQGDVTRRGENSSTAHVATSQPEFGELLDKPPIEFGQPRVNNSLSVSPAEPMMESDEPRDANTAESSFGDSVQDWRRAFLSARDGVAIFEFENGLKLLDVAMLNRCIYEKRVSSGQFSFIAMDKPFLVEVGAPERASTILKTMNQIGIDGELFGQSTLRITGGDSSIMLAGLSERVLTQHADSLLEVSVAKRLFNKIASDVSASEWAKVLSSSPSQALTNTAIIRLESRAAE